MEPGSKRVGQSCSIVHSLLLLNTALLCIWLRLFTSRRCATCYLSGLNLDRKIERQRQSKSDGDIEMKRIIREKEREREKLGK